MPDRLILSAEDIPANLSAWQDSGVARLMKDISGRRCLDSYVKSGRDGSLPKMLLDILTSVSTRLPHRWSLKASPSGRLLFVLLPLTRTIEGKGYREETITKITDILDVQGVEFLPGEGVKKKDRIIAVHEGAGANKILVEDFYNTLRDTGGEILIAHLVEGDASKELGADFLKEQIQKRKMANITHRVFVRESDPNLIPPFETYHVLPDDYFAAFPFYVYGSKLALFSRQPNPKAIIINDERFAESVRKLFNFVWDRTLPPKEKKEEQ